MTLQYKMIIPLLDNTITKEDLSSELLIDVYNTNINNPQLTNHIFLLFEYKLNAESIMRDERFLKSPMLYKSEFVKLKGKNCVLYTFCILNKDIYNIMDNSMLLSNESLLKIYRYWNFKDKDINKYAINQRIEKLFEDKSVPEYDYQPDWGDIFKINKGRPLE